MTRVLPRRALLLAPSAAALLGGGALLLLRATMAPPPQVWTIGGGPGPLVGHKVPAFTLPGLPGKPAPSSTGLTAAGRPVLINFFASWCLPCHAEMPMLASLAATGLPIWGIDFRDSAADAAGFLRQAGDPYRRIGCDTAGETARAFGIAGVPESFLVDPDGTVRWNWAGALTEAVLRDGLRPLLRPHPA